MSCSVSSLGDICHHCWTQSWWQGHMGLALQCPLDLGTCAEFHSFHLHLPNIHGAVPGSDAKSCPRDYLPFWAQTHQSLMCWWLSFPRHLWGLLWALAWQPGTLGAFAFPVPLTSWEQHMRTLLHHRQSWWLSVVRTWTLVGTSPWGSADPSLWRWLFSSTSHSDSLPLSLYLKVSVLRSLVLLWLLSFPSKSPCKGQFLVHRFTEVWTMPHGDFQGTGT